MSSAFCSRDAAAGSSCSPPIPSSARARGNKLPHRARAGASRFTPHREHHFAAASSASVLAEPESRSVSAGFAARPSPPLACALSAVVHLASAIRAPSASSRVCRLPAPPPERCSCRALRGSRRAGCGVPPCIGADHLHRLPFSPALRAFETALLRLAQRPSTQRRLEKLILVARDSAAAVPTARADAAPWPPLRPATAARAGSARPHSAARYAHGSR